MQIYIVEALGILSGPIDLPVIPGIGVQLPSNAVELDGLLPEPAAGQVWVMDSGIPQQLTDHRGTVYRTDTGEAVEWGELGALPDGLTTQPRPTADHSWVANSWQIDPELRTANRTALVITLCTRVDATADTARARVAGDPLRAVEYDRARIEAQAFADAGYPADAVPRTVAAWAISGRTPQQAADSILAEAAAYSEALYVIRETRLAAKEQIRALVNVGEVEQAQQLTEQTIAAIAAAVAGVGNNPAA
ncbi:hypothetical protein [Stutzerimonas balearica]|uniref:hypothetical protein n=1 Tax=Stutzerimonas balearica TaxID=74829 RepID=UPI0028A95443|nr:hypothetical protein [Stutzerimonas balearica]